jgi:hypothetical protein
VKRRAISREEETRSKEKRLARTMTRVWLERRSSRAISSGVRPVRVRCRTESSRGLRRARRSGRWEVRAEAWAKVYFMENASVPGREGGRHWRGNGRGTAEWGKVGGGEVGREGRGEKRSPDPGRVGETVGAHHA